MSVGLSICGLTVDIVVTHFVFVESLFVCQYVSHFFCQSAVLLDPGRLFKCVCLFACWTGCLPFCLSVCVSVCPSVCLPVCLSVCLAFKLNL